VLCALSPPLSFGFRKSCCIFSSFSSVFDFLDGVTVSCVCQLLSLLQNTWDNQLKMRKDLYCLLALEFSVHYHLAPLPLVLCKAPKYIMARAHGRGCCLPHSQERKSRQELARSQYALQDTVPKLVLKIPTPVCPAMDWVLAFHTWSCMAFHILSKAEQIPCWCLYVDLFICFWGKIPLYLIVALCALCSSDSSLHLLSAWITGVYHRALSRVKV
jgi:hypothetical protein